MISTKKPSGGGKNTPKVIQPGNVTCKILSVSLEKPAFDNNAYHLVFNVEGPDLGKDFEGFFINKDKPEMGRYKGQNGKIRAGRYPFAWETKNGTKRNRDEDIGVFITNLCTVLKYDGAIEGQTVEEFIDNFNKLKPFEGKFLRMCVWGREYVNRQGYTNHELYFPYPSKDGVPFELESIPENLSRVLKFDADKHVIKKDKPETVSSFEKPVTEATKDQFKL